MDISYLITFTSDKRLRDSFHNQCCECQFANADNNKKKGEASPFDIQIQSLKLVSASFLLYVTPDL